VAVAHHQPTPVLVELIDQRIDIGIGLGLQRGGQHPPGTLPRDLIQQRPRRHIARRHLTRAAYLNYLEHGRTFPTSVAAPALLDTNMATGKVRPARPQPQVSSIAPSQRTATTSSEDASRWRAWTMRSERFVDFTSPRRFEGWAWAVG